MTEQDTQDPRDPEERERIPLRDRNAEELMASLRKFRDQAKERSKVRRTAATVIADREAKKAKRAQSTGSRAARDEGANARLSVGIGLALLLVVGGCASGTAGIAAQSERAQQAQRAEIVELTSQLEQLRSDTDSAVDVETTQTAVEVQERLGEAQRKADEVAALQNEFAALLAAHPESSNNGVPSIGEQNAAKHRQSLVPYFASSTFLVDENIVYIAGSTFGLEPGQIDPRLQWYQRVGTAGDYSWTAVSAVPNESGNDSLIDVTWLCQDEASGELLAWATGLWSSNVDQFIELAVGTTALGDAEDALRVAGGAL